MGGVPSSSNPLHHRPERPRMFGTPPIPQNVPHSASMAHSHAAAAHPSHPSTQPNISSGIQGISSSGKPSSPNARHGSVFLDLQLQLKEATNVTGCSMHECTEFSRISRDVSVMHFVNIDDAKEEFYYDCQDHSNILKPSKMLLQNDGGYLFYEHKIQSLEEWTKIMKASCLEKLNPSNINLPPKIWWNYINPYLKDVFKDIREGIWFCFDEGHGVDKFFVKENGIDSATEEVSFSGLVKPYVKSSNKPTLSQQIAKFRDSPSFVINAGGCDCVEVVVPEYSDDSN
ncbi:hypothetical protein COLO4_03494 [Corchorus olitorius]|uniref:Uncharacterized protein n=1 Tax=Corchorus olitorius TaxID=93759 RepID=A0A1R3KYD8_9ROSI|nr:hypothetical protein COLO4_03494 [Corchorus olitorius]